VIFHFSGILSNGPLILDKEKTLQAHAHRVLNAKTRTKTTTNNSKKEY
jgi:hypothetical protein